MLGQIIAIVVPYLLAAIALDCLLMLWLRRRACIRAASAADVQVWGQPSPVLSWFSHALRPGSAPALDAAPEDGRPESTQIAAQAAAPEVVAEVTPMDVAIEEPPVRSLRQSWNALRDWAGSLFLAPGEVPLYPSGALAARSVRIELALIALVVLLFCAPFLDLKSDTLLPGNETQVFQALDRFTYDALRLGGQFPLWNPYLFSGLPAAADPMFHAFNPVASLPVLLLGPDAGFKVAVFLSLLIGALGMWWLCALFGISAPARVWMALVFAFAGQPVARFFQGQYLLLMGWAWLPWALGGLVALHRTRRRLFASLSALFITLIFLAGNAYYAFFFAMIAGLFALVMTLTVRRRSLLDADRPRLVLLLIVGALALGLAALQLLPTAQMWNRVSKAGGVVGSQTLQQVWLDLTSKDTLRADVYSVYPAREEFYAYIGVLPFAPLLALPWVTARRWRKDKRLLLFLLVMLAFSLAWIGTAYLPWADFYAGTRWLGQFRHQVRMIVFTEMAVLLLAGMGFDLAWRAVWTRLWRVEAAAWRRGAAGLACLGLLSLAVISAGDLFATHRPIVKSIARSENTSAAFAWLRERASGWTYTRYNPNNTAWLAAIETQTALLEPQYSFDEIRGGREVPGGRRPLRAHPNYVLQPVDYEDPPGGARVGENFGYEFFYFPDSLPFAFRVAGQVLDDDLALGEVRASEVTALPVYGNGTRFFEIIADGGLPGSGSALLALMVTNYPGWSLRVDGKPAAFSGYNGYLSTPLRPGTHQYRFTFTPGSFFLGLLISLLSLALAGWWLWREAQLAWGISARSVAALPRRGWAWLAARPEAIRANLVHKSAVREEREPEAGKSEPLIIRVGGISLTIERSQAQPGETPARPTGDPAARLARWMFVIALLVYAFTRLYALEKFPIYFFADEATNVLYAENLTHTGFCDSSGMLFPIYFEADGNRWTPLLSVYPHALSLALFGKSVVVTRATSAVISLLSALAVSLMLKKVFRVKHWWLGAAVMALIPAWFLHSRTAFETAMMTSFYAAFLLLYLLYRTRSPWFLYPALVMAAATFYCYSNGQVIMGVTGVLLLLSDIRYHLKNWRYLLPALLLGLLLAAPLLTFRANHPTGISDHLHAINSFMFQAIPWQEKALRFTKNYLYGLSPQYWFFANGTDLARHRMDSYGHIWALMLPLFLIGAGVFLKNLKSGPHRAILLAALAAPAGASLADIGITRTLSFVIPAGLLIAVGIDWLLQRASRWVSQRWLGWASLVVLSACSLGMLNASLVKGPLWFHDYGLYGMQYGATQLFEDVIPRYLANDPNAVILLTSSWANASDRFVTFFLPEEQRARVRMEGVQSYTFKEMPLNPNTYFIMSAGELKVARDSGKFKTINVLENVPYPDGSTGFVVAQMAYVDNITGVFAAEKEARRRLEEAAVDVGGETLTVRHSMLDMGTPQLAFDGDIYTLMRGLEANPFVLEVDFPTPRMLSMVTLDCGTLNMQISVTVYPPGDGKPQTFTQKYRDLLVGATQVDLPLGEGGIEAARLHIEILASDLSPDAAVNVHVREVSWK